MHARRLILLASFASAFLAARGARASDCNGTIVSSCIDDDTLWPHAGASRFLGFGGAETLAPGALGFGLVTSYLSRPIVIDVPSPGPTGNGSGAFANAINDQLNATFLWSYGVTRRLELDIALPVTFAQGGTGIAPISGGTGLNTTAVRDMRYGFAYGLLRGVPAITREGALSVVGRLEASAPTGDRDQLAGERTAVFIPSVSADFRSGKWFVGAELGARLRPVTELLGARIGSEGVVALGAGYDILPKKDLLTAVVEARALPNFAQQNTVQATAEGLVSSPNGKYIVPAEWTVSARTAPIAGGAFSVQLGGGGMIPFSSDSAPTAPRFRFTLGIRYAPVDAPPAAAATPAAASPGVGPAPAAHVPFDPPLGRAPDPCTDEPESADGFRTDDACPDEDSDKDGIPNRMDPCPLDSEDFSGLPDGCPAKGSSP